MEPTLATTLQQLRQAISAEQVFGAANLASAQALRRSYRKLAAQTHPDHHPDQTTAAHEAFQLLQHWYEQAQQRIAATTGRYHDVGVPLAGDLCDLYPAQARGQAVLLKAARQPRNHDLLQAEARTLARLAHELDGKPLRAHFPTLIEHFLLRGSDGSLRHVNMLRREEDCFTLAEVEQAFPGGLPLADAAWMFNRLLVALGVAHGLGLVHGAVTPAHVLIRPADHNGLLLDWCYCVPNGQPVKAISRPYAADYAPEVLARQPASPATDLFMAARCLLRLLGGQRDPEDLPVSAPPPLRALLRACLIPSPMRRVGDAWQLFDDFRDILQRLYGPPAFRPFRMPGH